MDNPVNMTFGRTKQSGVVRKKRNGCINIQCRSHRIRNNRLKQSCEKHHK